MRKKILISLISIIIILLLTSVVYGAVSNAIFKMREAPACEARIADDWAEDIEKDFESRK